MPFYSFTICGNISIEQPSFWNSFVTPSLMNSTTVHYYYSRTAIIRLFWHYPRADTKRRADTIRAYTVYYCFLQLVYWSIKNWFISVPWNTLNWCYRRNLYHSPLLKTARLYSIFFPSIHGVMLFIDLHPFSIRAFDKKKQIANSVAMLLTWHIFPSSHSFPFLCQTILIWWGKWNEPQLTWSRSCWQKKWEVRVDNFLCVIGKFATYITHINIFSLFLNPRGKIIQERLRGPLFFTKIWICRAFLPGPTTKERQIRIIVKIVFLRVVLLSFSL